MLDERTQAELTLELRQLERLLSEYRPLIEDALANEPDLIKRTAIGAVLQSFYNGVEGLFQTIAKRVDRNVPTGETWHKDLLQQMGKRLKTGVPLFLKEWSNRSNPIWVFAIFQGTPIRSDSIGTRCNPL